MKSSQRWAIRRLPLRVQFRSNSFRKRHPATFGRLENLLYNTYGPPILRLEISRLKRGSLYWRKNRDGLWARFGNVFYFANEEVMQVALRFMPPELVILN